MPDGHTSKHRNRKSVQLLNLSSQQEDSTSLDYSEDSDFVPVPLTAAARSTALSFATTSHLTQEGSSAEPVDSSKDARRHQGTSSSSKRNQQQGGRRSSVGQFFSSFTLQQPPSQIPRSMAMTAMSIISPRSSNYERLEGGMGPSRMPAQAKGWRRFGWKKFAVGAAALIFVVWLWGPRESRLDWQSVKEGIKKPLVGEGEVEWCVLSLFHFKSYDYAKPGGTAKQPLSFETDPDPRKTTFCTKPHDPSSHLVQYALMIDAGSTGSRIHVYKFNNCQDSPSYEYEVFKMTQPGLSSFAGKPLDAAKSLDVLLDEAVRVVPKELHHCTPVAVKATAGLRLLPGRQSNDILEKVEERIREKYDFQLPDHEPVVVMDGKDEGVYAWITANYLLGTISAGGSAKSKSSSDTYAVLDLGGASTQIVFEPNFTPKHPSGRLEEGEHKYDLDFGGKTYELYQHSYLGYGLMRARSHVHRLVDFMASIRPGATSKFHSIDQDGDGHPDLDVIPNPCLAKGTMREVEVKDEMTGKMKKVWMAGEDVGSFEACERVVQLVLAKDAVCEMKPCSFNGVYQPSLLDSFKNGKVLLLSYFYDRLAPLLPPKSSTPLKVETFASMAKTVCAGPDSWAKQEWSKDHELMEELEGRPEWCLDLTFMHALLRLGYEFEDERRIDIGKKIKNTELGWCLGATIAMLEWSAGSTSAAAPTCLFSSARHPFYYGPPLARLLRRVTPTLPLLHPAQPDTDNQPARHCQYFGVRKEDSDSPDFVPGIAAHETNSTSPKSRRKSVGMSAKKKKKTRELREGKRKEEEGTDVYSDSGIAEVVHCDRITPFGALHQHTTRAHYERFTDILPEFKVLRSLGIPILEDQNLEPPVRKLSSVELPALQRLNIVGHCNLCTNRALSSYEKVNLKTFLDRWGARLKALALRDEGTRRLSHAELRVGGMVTGKLIQALMITSTEGSPEPLLPRPRQRDSWRLSYHGACYVALGIHEHRVNPVTRRRRIWTRRARSGMLT
ncbi:hypothetical protein NMY22_g4762 [Coprinellus aureogranulatus]|nr:hypothetical protein NMY22_g4762 [Coprinellus aureogranulatus]